MTELEILEEISERWKSGSPIRKLARLNRTESRLIATYCDHGCRADILIGNNELGFGGRGSCEGQSNGHVLHSTYVELPATWLSTAVILMPEWTNYEWFETLAGIFDLDWEN